jgi:hypothetical protein
MKRVRLLGLALMAVFALGVAAAATASAAPGILFLEKESAPVEFTGTSGAGELKTPAGTIKCTANTDSGTIGTTGETHPNLGTATITFTGCKEKKVETLLACSSENAKGEKDAKETILLKGDLHVVELLNAKNELEAGVAVILLETLLLNCGGGKVEVRGAAFGLVLASLTADVTAATLDFVAAGETCDTSDTLCKEIKEKFPLEGNFSGKFEKAEEITEAKVTFNKMVLFDD